VDEGRISEEEAAHHPHRSLLIRVLNGHPAADPDITTVKVQEGDRLLFCSDGVCGLVDDTAIAEALQRSDLSEAMDQLVDAARDAGGIDNITLIVADVVAEGGTSQTAVLGAAAEHTPPATAERPAQGEDTLITERPAPAQQAHEDEARYNPQLPHHHRVARPLLALVAMVLILIAGLGAAWAWTRTQFYVGAVNDQVAIFQGLSDPVPGVRLSHVYEVQDLTVSSLPPYYQAKVRDTIEVMSLSAARETVNELAAAARRCAPSQGGSASAKPSGSPTSGGGPGQPSGSPTTSATLTSPPPAEPSQTPSATVNPGSEC
jgi:PPM family protein phosphatase